MFFLHVPLQIGLCCQHPLAYVARIMVFRLELPIPLWQNVSLDVGAYVVLFADVVANQTTEDTNLTCCG